MNKMTTVGTSLLLGLIAFIADASEPNIVYILADDMGIGDARCYNPDGKIPTPHIDRLASEGMMFTDAHTNSSVCTPTRYGILTGRYAWRTERKKGVTQGHSPHLIDPDRETVASLLKKHGYRTACVGKWHLGMDWPKRDLAAMRKAKNEPTSDISLTAPIKNGPNAVGFDYYFGISASLNMSPHAYIENRQIQGDLELVQTRSELVERGVTEESNPGLVARNYVQEEVLSTLAGKACEWIRDDSDSNKSGSPTAEARGPFFLYLPLPSPHSPIVPSDGFKGKSGLNGHGDFVMETDWVVGQVLKTLDELGIADDTIVIYTSDNGTSPKANPNQMRAKGHHTSGIYRGLKGTLWEGGHRVPFVFRWPKKVKPGTVSDQPICTTDLMATCAELLGETLPDDVGEDSVSFLPATTGETISGVADRLIVHHSDRGIFAVRRGKWKMLLDDKGGSPRGGWEEPSVVNNSNHLLFDMERDPAETINLSLENSEVMESLKQGLAELIRKGRSTPGVDQPTDLETAKWPQIDMLRDYLK